MFMSQGPTPETMLRPSVLYRVSAVLLVLFALGHQIGFRQVDPSWNADAVAGAMRSVRFGVQGFQRSYWEFFSGFGFFVTTLLVFSAALAFELSRLPAQVLLALSRVRWAFALCYLVTAALTWAYFFLAPDIFATLVALCLVFAATVQPREEKV